MKKISPVLSFNNPPVFLSYIPLHFGNSPSLSFLSSYLNTVTCSLLPAQFLLFSFLSKICPPLSCDPGAYALFENEGPGVFFMRSFSAFFCPTLDELAGTPLRLPGTQIPPLFLILTASFGQYGLEPFVASFYPRRAGPALDISPYRL